MSAQNNEEGMTTLEGIQASLDTLVKAAEATDMVKAYGNVSIDQYGHTDERGETSGGYADSGDIGGTDDMMIGKMQQALIDQGFSADQISAFMRGKQEEDEDDEDPHAAALARKGDGKMSRSGNVITPTDAKKSMDAFMEDQDIVEAFDVVPFLEGLVSKAAEQIDSLSKSLAEAQHDQREFNQKMAAAVYGIGQLAKSSTSVLAALDERLGLIEAQPMPQKGYTQMTGARPIQKSFGHHGFEGQPAGGEQLTKSELINTLSYMNLEKGIRDIGGQPTHEIVSLFEGGGQLSQRAYHAATGFLQTHPHEADIAKSYR